MSIFFPRIAFAPARCATVAAPTFRQEIAPLWSLFDDATRQIQQLERQARRAQFQPRFDVKEDKESYILEGEVPGFKDNELSIEWNDNVLAIKGKHESVIESGKKPETVEAPVENKAIEETPAAASSTAAAESETSSVKSHQATVEDEEPSYVSVAAEEASSSSSPSQAAPAPEQKTVAAPTKTVTPKKQEPKVQHWISERRSGHFLRQFAFPSNAVNHEAIKASLQSGILKIVVPKAPTPESRRINIE